MPYGASNFFLLEVVMADRPGMNKEAIRLASLASLEPSNRQWNKNLNPTYSVFNSIHPFPVARPAFYWWQISDTKHSEMNLLTQRITQWQQNETSFPVRWLSLMRISKFFNINSFHWRNRRMKNEVCNNYLKKDSWSSENGRILAGDWLRKKDAFRQKESRVRTFFQILLSIEIDKTWFHPRCR